MKMVLSLKPMLEMMTPIKLDEMVPGIASSFEEAEAKIGKKLLLVLNASNGCLMASFYTLGENGNMDLAASHPIKTIEDIAQAYDAMGQLFTAQTEQNDGSASPEQPAGIQAGGDAGNNAEPEPGNPAESEPEPGQ